MGSSELRKFLRDARFLQSWRSWSILILLACLIGVSHSIIDFGMGYTDAGIRDAVATVAIVSLLIIAKLALDLTRWLRGRNSRRRS